MKTTANQAASSEPTHDEIALNAFLTWEQDGRQPGRDQFYWGQAENHLRDLYRQKAELASVAQSPRNWPPQPEVATARGAQASASPAKSAKSDVVWRAPKAKPAKRQAKPVRSAVAAVSASRLPVVSPSVNAASAAKSVAGSRSSARR